MKHAVLNRHDHSVESFNHDGLELARRKKYRRTFPVGKFLQFMLAIFAFKIFLFLQMGPVAYAEKRHDLAESGTFGRIAAGAMALDPVSKKVVDTIRFAL
ncbi:hypothetical protein [Psychromarinibacter sp. S121]|uniref:hypothetical protein n=1 Tax=Psychromarinibacter sp. S121 TaxID=3415127 RepID=UPI003C7AE9F3